MPDHYPRIPLPGSNTYWVYDEAAERLEALFPGQDAYELCQAFCHNGGFIANLPDLNYGLSGLLMLEQGCRDQGDWVWLIRTSTSRGGNDSKHFIVTAGCDYTGWDCQSFVHVDPWPETVAGQQALTAN